MRSVAYQPIKALIRAYLAQPKYKKYWERMALKKAWCTVFPHMKDQIKRLAMKQHTLYITLQSIILTHELRKSKDMVRKRIQQALRRLSFDGIVIQRLVLL